LQRRHTGDFLHIVRIAKTYAFFSETMHRKYKGSTTADGANEHVAPGGGIGRPEDIYKVRANWIGPSIGGYPGVIEQGHLVRPANFESYQLVGEVDPIEDQPAFNSEGRAIFWEVSRASPERVFATDAAETGRNRPRHGEVNSKQLIGMTGATAARPFISAPLVSPSYMEACLRVGMRVRRPVGKIFDPK
jgi:hypothetical protein